MTSAPPPLPAPGGPDSADTDRISSDRTSTDPTSTDVTSTDVTSTDVTSTDVTSTDVTSTDVTSTDVTGALAGSGAGAGATLTPGFRGRPRPAGVTLPPGQYKEEGFPVLSAGPTPNVDSRTWNFTVTDESGAAKTWTWAQLMALPQDTPTVDIHCVTRWSKFGTRWRGVSLDVLLADVESTADFAMVGSYGGYTTNLPVADLLGGKAWIAHTFDGAPLHPEHGGPARLLVPHLYFWKSAKWVRSLTLMPTDRPGFWEKLGYHDLGDPWREQRYQGD